MTESEFEKLLAEATQLASSGTSAQKDYADGYLRGLRRHHHGDKFGSDEEHQKWLSLGHSRVAEGKGYLDGFAGEPVNPESVK